jgi:hypothetical protein
MSSVASWCRRAEMPIPAGSPASGDEDLRSRPLAERASRLSSALTA